MTLDQMTAAAREAAKSSARWLLLRNYVNGVRTIAHREPSPNALSLMWISTSDYARVAGMSIRAAREDLRALAEAGRLIERRNSRPGAVLRFTFPSAENEEIARNMIAELRETGLPFDDDYMRGLGE